MNKEQALNDLSKCGGHAILRVDFARKVADAFGFKLHTYKIRDERSQFKGAYMPDVKEGESVEAVDALSLMYQVAKALKYDIKADYFGRGSQFDAGMRELREYIKAPATTRALTNLLP